MDCHAIVSQIRLFSRATFSRSPLLRAITACLLFSFLVDLLSIQQSKNVCVNHFQQFNTWQPFLFRFVFLSPNTQDGNRRQNELGLLEWTWINSWWFFVDLDAQLSKMTQDHTLNWAFVITERVKELENSISALLTPFVTTFWYFRFLAVNRTTHKRAIQRAGNWTWPSSADSHRGAKNR